MRILATVLMVLMSATIALATPLDITGGGISVTSNRSTSFQDAIFYALQGDRVGIQGFYERKFYAIPGLVVQLGVFFIGGYYQVPETRIDVEGFEPCVAESYLDNCGGIVLKTDQPMPMGIDFAVDTVTLPFQAMAHLQVGENCPIHFGDTGSCPGVDVVGQGLVSIHWVAGYGPERNEYFPEAAFRFFSPTPQTSAVPEPSTLAFLPIGLLGLILILKR